ncbi:hypothetical protein GUJ93_ZPchr0010g9674 [Zizania palustris]|uniref:Uncharacterized protein n=1 Tax=Zizania palustris TaxID=103762 RepID=A0A8J6BG62_ZIZPA|nr:hypothetical protein GUJ93_ZPchr0010g9674 [Zizania palustris]
MSSFSFLPLRFGFHIDLTLQFHNTTTTTTTAAAMMPMPPELQDDGDDFTFPTPPQPRLFSSHHQSSPAPPVWLLSSPIRRSFSAADCAASPWRNARIVLRRRGGGGGGAFSPALSDYAAAAGFFDEDDDDDEERMDSLWEGLNDEDASPGKRDLFLNSLDVARRRLVGGPDLAEKRKPASKDSEGAMLGSSKSSRRRPAGLVAMMRSLKKLLVAHKGKNKTAACSNSGKK